MYVYPLLQREKYYREMEYTISFSDKIKYQMWEKGIRGGITITNFLNDKTEIWMKP